jgi:hypothetical protein
MQAQKWRVRICQDTHFLLFIQLSKSKLPDWVAAGHHCSTILTVVHTVVYARYSLTKGCPFFWEIIDEVCSSSPTTFLIYRWLISLGNAFSDNNDRGARNELNFEVYLPWVSHSA